jgi:hypothetical protein
MVRCIISLVGLAALLSQASAAQVATSIRMSKQEYLAGEPIVMLIEVKNIGSDTVAYDGGCDFGIKMSIAGVQPKPSFSNEGCFVGHGQGGSCGGEDHPPGLTSGQSVLFKRLLTGYRLGPGSYTLQASGMAPMRWWLFPTTDPKHSPKYPVDGAHFSGEVDFQVRAGSEDELKEAFAPWMEEAESPKFTEHTASIADATVRDDPALARRAIAETAPPFLEDFVLKFAKKDFGFTIATLRNMNTSSSRRALVDLYEESKDAEQRTKIVDALQEIANPEQVDFFAPLLVAKDAAIQRDAILAMGRIGGWRGVAELVRVQSDDRSVNETINNALSMTRSPDAVSVLIERYRQGPTGDSVCGALATLTHLAWCKIPEEGRVQSWRRFWAQHGAETPIYGDDDCEGAFAPKPLPRPARDHQ